MAVPSCRESILSVSTMNPLPFILSVCYCCVLSVKKRSINQRARSNRCIVYASSIEDIRDRCEIEGQQPGRDLTQLAPGACNSAYGHSETARVRPHPLMGPRMASVAARPIFSLLSDLGETLPNGPRGGRRPANAILGPKVGWGQTRAVPMCP